MSKKITPRGNNVLVKKVKATDENGKGGGGGSDLYIPDSSKKYVEAVIVEVGDGNLHPQNAHRVGSDFKAGDVVIYTPSFEVEVESEGEELYLIDEDSIVGVVEEIIK